MSDARKKATASLTQHHTQDFHLSPQDGILRIADMSYLAGVSWAQPYLIASPDHVICSTGSFKLVLVQHHFTFNTGTLYCLDHVSFFSDNVSSVVHVITIILLYHLNS